MPIVNLPGPSLEEIAAELTEAVMAIGGFPGHGQTDPRKRQKETLEVYRLILTKIVDEAE